MSIFRGPKEGTLPDGSVIATQGDIAEALTEAIAAQSAAENAQQAAENALDTFGDQYLGAKTSDPATDNDGDALIDGALYYNTTDNVLKAYDADSDAWISLNLSEQDQSNVNTVANISTQVETVGNNISDVQNVSTNISGIDTIGTVASDINDVTAVGVNIADVVAVATNLSGPDTIGTVANSISDVNTVATDIADVNTTATNIADVQVVAADLNETTSEIEVVAGSIADVNSVGSNISDVNNVGSNIGNVNTVADISTDVTTVAGDEQDIGTVSTNISSVDVIASDLAGAGFDYDLGSVTQATEGVVGTPDGYIITVFNIRDDITTVSGISSDVSTVADNVADVTNFADVYIGPESSDPSTRRDGSALQNGDLYFNTTDNRLKVYDGSQWEVTARDDSDIKSLFSGAGDITYDSATGQFSVTTFKSSDFDSNFASKTTDDLTEGGNLYYTDSRVNARIDSRVDKTFVDALNVDSDTLDGQEGTYYLDRANHTGTQTLSTISDSGALAALDEVDTAQIANQAVTDDKLATSLDLGSI